MKKTANIRTGRNGMTDQRRQRRAFNTAMSQGLNSTYKPAEGGSRMEEFLDLLEKADRKISKI